jgi:hypothetical protein
MPTGLLHNESKTPLIGQLAAGLPSSFSLVKQSHAIRFSLDPIVDRLALLFVLGRPRRLVSVNHARLPVAIPNKNSVCRVLFSS